MPGDEDWALEATRQLHLKHDGDEASVQSFIRNPDNLMLVAHEGEQVVGSLNGHFLRRPNGKKQFLLYEIDVLQSHRRRGIGKALVERAKHLAMEQEASEMWVLTDSDDPAPHALYWSCGGRMVTKSDRMYVFDLTLQPDPAG